MDILAALASDPTALPLWAVLAFAAGMYPVGMMFSCRTCCRCSACTVGELPQTVTVTFDNFVDEEEVQGPDLISISATACFGSGLSAKATAPGGYPETNAGPLSKISITNGGSGYAVLGRVEPTITISGGSGTGADFEVTLAEEVSRCAPSMLELSGGSGTGMVLSITVGSNGDTPETFGIQNVLVMGGGENYEVDDVFAVDIGSGDVEVVEAVVKVTAVDSSGGIVSVTIEEPGGYYKSGAGIPTWTIDGVTIASGGDGGTGYVDGDQLAATVAAPGSEAAAAALSCRTTLSEPTLTPAVGGGSDAAFTVTLTEATSWTGRPYWYISAITVDDGGSGYTDGAEMTFTLGPNGVESSAAYAVVMTSRSTPTLVELFGGTGTSAVLGVSIASNGGSPETWGISSVTITDGGAGYLEGDVFSVNIGAGDVEVYGASVSVTAVDGAGAITGVSIDYGGDYYHDDGIIESVDLYDGGAYWDDDGVIAEVVVDNGGSYYEEDASEPPYVSDVDLLITQTAPSAGTGAVLSATVDDDTSSPTFGQITAVAIDTAGDDYLAWEWLTNYLGCCGDHYNGKTVVARRGLDGDNCEYIAYFCGSGSMWSRSGRLLVRYRGPGLVPLVQLSSEHYPSESPSTVCNTSFFAPSNIEDCDEFSFVATSAGGRTATVAPGGDYDQADGNPNYITNGFPSCNICCRGTAEAPREIVVAVTDNRPGGTLSGNYTFEAALWDPYYGTGNKPARILRWKYSAEDNSIPFFIYVDTTTFQYRNFYRPYFGDRFDPPYGCHSCFMQAWAFYGSVENYSSGLSIFEEPVCGPSGQFNLNFGANPAAPADFVFQIL